MKKLVDGVLVDLTQEEIAQRELDAQAALTAQAERERQATRAQLDELDRRSIRALREGDAQRILQLEVEAAALRAQLNA